MSKLSDRAYAKMFLHAVKYPHCDVVGALVIVDGVIVDAVPLSHNPINALIADSGLAVVDRMARKADAQLGGLYFGKGSGREDVLGSVHARLAEDVAAQCGGLQNIVVLQISRALLSKPSISPVQRFSRKASGQWTMQDGSAPVVEAAVIEAADSAIDSARKLIDFEDSLAAPGADLQNAWVDALVTKAA